MVMVRRVQSRSVPAQELWHLFFLIHRSAWKGNSPKFAVAISGVSSPIKPPSCRVERDHPRSPPHVATNGARKRSKLLRLATGRLPENFGGPCELRHNGVLGSSPWIFCFVTFAVTLGSR